MFILDWPSLRKTVQNQVCIVFGRLLFPVSKMNLQPRLARRLSFLFSCKHRPGLLVLSQLRREICWKYVLRWSPRKFSRSFLFLFFSLTWKMCSYLNMRTNELGHVQSYFILPAPIPICLSGQQAWIDYSAYCIWKREWKGVKKKKKKKAGAHLFHHGLRQPFETQWYEADPQIRAYNLALSCHVLKCLIHKLLRPGASFGMPFIHLASIFFRCRSLIFP